MGKVIEFRQFREKPPAKSSTSVCGGRDDLSELRMQERSRDRTTSRMQVCVSSDAAGLKASNRILVVNHPHPQIP